MCIGALGAGAWWLWGGTDKAPPPLGSRAGSLVGKSAVGAANAAKNMRSPYRCARWGEEDDVAPNVITAFDRQLERAGATLRITGGDDSLTIGFLGDVRGNSEANLAQLAIVRSEFERLGVELVVSLGGMAKDEAGIRPTLSAIAHNARWPVVAIPGGREDLVDHRAAVASLANEGRSVIYDGAAVRIIQMDGATIGTIPGVSEPGQLLAGNGGCVHGVTSMMEFAEHLVNAPEPRIIASYAPPRQRGSDASDLAAGGIHIGEPAIATMMEAAKPTVVVHALVDEAATEVHAQMQRARTTPLIAGTGSAEALPLALPNGRLAGGSALIVRIRGRRVDYQRIGLPVGVR